MVSLYKRFCDESFDENNILNKFSIKCPQNFNFGYDVVDEIAKNEPNRRAMVWVNDQGQEKTFTFSDISRYSNKVANMLLNSGIKKGDKVLLILKRHYEFWFAIVALHKIGAVAIPASNLLTTKDVVYRVNNAHIKGIICTNDGEIKNYVDVAQKKCTQESFKKFLVHGKKDTWIDFDEGMENYPDTLDRIDTKYTDEMLAFFTSGTTGQPKLVMHNYGYPLGHIVTAKYWHKVVPDGLHLTLADTGWAKAAWGKIYGQWIAAAGLFVYDYDKFNPLDILKFIEKYKITTFCAPPTVYRFFIKEGMTGFDLSSLTHASVAGEALNNEVYKRFYEYTGLKLMEGFGQSESALLIGNLINSIPKPGSMGKPSPQYDIDLVDESLNSVDVGVVGEIVVRPNFNSSVSLLQCYKDAPESNEKVWAGGVYHTGDTAYKDENGYYWYVGRTDDIIKSSGYRIGPFEVESVLMEHPAVLECAITGAPDPVRGQVVKATIVLTSQYKKSDDLAKEIQNFVKKTTAPYKYPRIVEFVDEMPKTISGKIKRGDIRNESKNKSTIKHIVFWSVNSEAKNKLNDVITTINNHLIDIKSNQSGIKVLQVGKNFINNEYDICLYSEFDCKDSLDTYQICSEHIKLKEYMATIVENRAVCDFEI